jgi:hypothetical protein
VYTSSADIENSDDEKMVYILCSEDEITSVDDFKLSDAKNIHNDVEGYDYVPRILNSDTEKYFASFDRQESRFIPYADLVLKHGLFHKDEEKLKTPKRKLNCCFRHKRDKVFDIYERKDICEMLDQLLLELYVIMHTSLTENLTIDIDMIRPLVGKLPLTKKGIACIKSRSYSIYDTIASGKLKSNKFTADDTMRLSDLYSLTICARNDFLASRTYCLITLINT